MSGQEQPVARSIVDGDIATTVEQERAAERQALRAFSATSFTESAKDMGLPLTIENEGVNITISHVKAEATKFLKNCGFPCNAVNAPALRDAFLRVGGPKIRRLAPLETMRRAALLAIERCILELKLSRQRRGERAFFDPEVGKRVEHMSELALLEQSHYIAEARARKRASSRLI